jgi:hypothetical protein
MILAIITFLGILGALSELLSIIAISYSIATFGLTDILSIKLTLSLLCLVINIGAVVMLIKFQEMKNDL